MYPIKLIYNLRFSVRLTKGKRLIHARFKIQNRGAVKGARKIKLTIFAATEKL